VSVPMQTASQQKDGSAPDTVHLCAHTVPCSRSVGNRNHFVKPYGGVQDAVLLNDMPSGRRCSHALGQDPAQTVPPS
jgi:hypothetical protein